LPPVILNEWIGQNSSINHANSGQQSNDNQTKRKRLAESEFKKAGSRWLVSRSEAAGAGGTFHRYLLSLWHAKVNLKFRSGAHVREASPILRRTDDSIGLICANCSRLGPAVRNGQEQLIPLQIARGRDNDAALIYHSHCLPSSWPCGFACRQTRETTCRNSLGLTRASSP
jgi:hypothetical protein